MNVKLTIAPIVYGFTLTGASGAVPFDDGKAGIDDRRPGFIACESAQNAFSREASDFDALDPHGSERWISARREIHIAEADYREILRYAQASGLRFSQNAQSERVGTAGN